MALTPMMQQYMQVKEQYKDCILFYRLGDFYEMFFDDAVTACRDMDVVLTHRACGEGEKAPMCGVPYHAVDTYVARLIEKGHKVAICEQMEDPALAKGIVQREVIRVITPGTVLSDTMLSDRDNNFLACIYENNNSYDLSWCDISTGEFYDLILKGTSLKQQLLSELIKIQPKEVITNLTQQSSPEIFEMAQMLDNCVFFNYPKGNSAADSILQYLNETQKQELTHLSELKLLSIGDTMCLDRATVKNLELTETLFEHKVKGSLLGVLDRTKTAMGGRKLKAWIREPLNKKDQIEERLNAVECLYNDVLLRNNLRESLKSVYDLERLCARIACKTANARDLLALKSSVAPLPDIKAELSGTSDKLLGSYDSQIQGFEDIYELLDKAIVDEPPMIIREGGMIKPGYSQELDDIVNSVADKQQWIANLENIEKERTGIRTLKVGFNKVFGYYIEVSKSFTDKVPLDYVRKQTLVNCERYITPDLKEAENIVLNAQTKINDLQYRLFSEIREYIEERIPDLQRSSAAIAAVDVLASFAECAVKQNYVKPAVTDGDLIKIEKGRHPVIEDSVKDGMFVSNDIYLNRSDASMLLITGPNMSGKSTYMRQLALIVLMAQAGSFVPAKSAEIGICDRIYTRIGASDNITMGQSTFYVEMSELAYILNTATDKSLVILDEIGRGTSTYDGLSIAWAVVEKLSLGKNKIRTLFATHYHELTELADSMDGVKNLNVDVSEENGNIVFLHKIVEGAASKSYGIHVAKLAGVPKDVLDSANGKLETLVSGSVSLKGPEESMIQLSLFEPQDSVIAEKLRNLDLMDITGSKALAILEDLQKYARGDN